MDNNIPLILQALGCDYVKDRGNYYTATRPNGNNRSSVVVYKDTLVANCYTAAIEGDIITLVEHFQGLYFSYALKWICDLLEVDYYSQVKKRDDLISDWEWLNPLLGIKDDASDQIKPIPESVLKEYIRYPHINFLNDNISIAAQKEFEIHYNLRDDRIIIPIRDELGNLIGVKGRATREEDEIEGYKYMALYKYPKTKILYGLYKTLPYIKEQNELVITEAEKGVLQLWTAGIKNSIAIGSHKISDAQLEKVLRLNVPVVIAYDKVVKERKLYYDEMNRTIEDAINKLRPFTKVSVIFDKDNILEDRESPMDQPEKWQKLYKNRIYIR